MVGIGPGLMLCLLLLVPAAALEVLWGGEFNRIKLLALGRDGWTAAQYADIMLQLLGAKYHAMPVEQARMLLGVHTAATTPASQEEAGETILQCLVKANALSVRPKSAWATDISDEAFAADKAIVTAPSSLELYCVGQLRGKLEQTLQLWQQEQQQAQQQYHEQVGSWLVQPRHNISTSHPTILRPPVPWPAARHDGCLIVELGLVCYWQGQEACMLFWCSDALCVVSCLAGSLLSTGFWSGLASC